MQDNFLYFLGFLSFLVPYIVIWGRLLWFLSERSLLVRKIVIFCMTYSHDSYEVIKSKVLGVAYFFYTFGGFIGMSLIWGRGFFHLFTFSKNTIIFALLGFCIEIMLISVFLGIFLPILKQKISNRVAEEVGETPWIQGIATMEKKVLVMLFPGISGFFEELFFRGSLLYILIHTMQVNVWISVGVVTFLFLIQQILQLQSIGQIIIIGLSCIIISFVGSLLVLYTNEIVSAAIAHALFAIFYVSWSKDVSN